MVDLFFIWSSLPYISSERVQIVSNFALIGTTIASFVVFSYTYKQNKKSELKTIHEILKYFTDAEN